MLLFIFLHEILILGYIYLILQKQPVFGLERISLPKIKPKLLNLILALCGVGYLAQLLFVFRFNEMVFGIGLMPVAIHAFRVTGIRLFYFRYKNSKGPKKILTGLLISFFLIVSILWILIVPFKFYEILAITID